jgi:hypothetical protein
MTKIKVKFSDWSAKDMKNWLIAHVGKFKYTVGDTMYHDVGNGWQLYIAMSPTNTSVFWIAEISSDEQATAFKLRFL